MTLLSSTTCVTCSKTCYPTERLRVSDLWVHKQGCLKCSTCSTTLSLASAYVAASPVNPSDKLLFCAKDVPRIVHTSIVDSVALKAALNAPNPTTVPQGVFEGRKGAAGGRSIRFKGLTLRSKGIVAGLNAPKLAVAGKMPSRIIIGQVGGVGLDSWDIAHAMNVQSQVSSPIRSHPAIHAQRTGTAATQWPMPSQPLEPQFTGAPGEEVMSAQKGEEEVHVEPDMVRNLIKVFQLDSLEQVEVDSGLADLIDLETTDEVLSHLTGSSAEGYGTVGTMKPPASIAASFAPSTFRTIRTLGGRKGTLTLARMKAPCDRPALKDLFAVDAPTPTLQLAPPVHPAAPPNTPVKEDGNVSCDGGALRGILKHNGGTACRAKSAGTIRSGKLLEALLPLAAHLVPLPDDDDDDLVDDHIIVTCADDVEESDLGDEGDLRAVEELAETLDLGGLELIMLFEEEAVPVGIEA